MLRGAVLAPLALLASLALGALGCEARVSLGAACQYDSECPDPLRCRFGRCRAECLETRDCLAPGAICIGPAGSGACTLPTDTCANDCADGLVCAGELCTTACASSDDCLGGSTCSDVGGVMACVAAPTSDAGVQDAPDLGDAPLDAGPLDAGPITPGSAPRRLCIGHDHACVIRGGQVFCWGSNQGGQLGDGDAPGAYRVHSMCTGGTNCAPQAAGPVQIDPDGAPLTDAIALSCGTFHTCALTSAGSVYCWGTTSNDQLGHGGFGNIAAPSLRDPGFVAEALASGRYHTCARAGGEHRCWGANATDTELGPSDGRLGQSDVFQATTPRAAPDFAGARELAAGGLFTCVVDAAGAVHCQGRNEAGVTGDVTTFGADPAGGTIAGLPSWPTDLAAGILHACALSGGAIYCWGGNTNGQLGAASERCSSPVVGFCRGAAVRVEETTPRTYVSLSRGYSLTSCAVTVEGAVVCWGNNDFGQCGVVVPENVQTPGAPVAGIEKPIVEVASAGESSCARSADDDVWCWGRNTHGQLGRGSSDGVAHPDPAPVLGLPL